MLFALVVTLTMVVVLTAALWPDARERTAEETTERGTEPEKAAPAGPATLEGVLVRQVLGGEISRRQYQRAMAGIAARAARREAQGDLGRDLGGTGRDFRP